MAQQQRNPYKLKSPGPYLAVVKNNLDPGYMGGLEVSLISGFVDDTEKIAGQSLKVKYLNPFYGVTNYKFEGPDTDDGKNFNEVQKSYGMWFVPPDIGTMVLVIFVGGEYNEGYWFGCVQDRYQNHMIPGIPAQELPSNWLTSEQKRRYGTDVNYLPVAEFNKKVAFKSGSVSDIRAISKPVHPFANRLAEQGLLKDTTRGVTSSGARREIPSSVFGISTPGPLDKANDAKRGSIEYDSRNTPPTPVSRLGGSQFVMDDGDANGNNELVRLRTRTGHQILLHNTQDLVYIANSKGTAWIELTSNGKIDIYAHDDVSIHSEGNFNLRAGKDFNIEAVGNLNLRSWQNTNIDVNKSLNINVRGPDTVKISSVGAVYINSESTIQLASTGKLEVSSNSDIDIRSQNFNAMASQGLNFKGSTVKTTAGKVYTNDKKNSATSAEISNINKADQLIIRNLPATDINVKWDNDAFYAAGEIQSTVYRAPMHEPWPIHENINPTDVLNPVVIQSTIPGKVVSVTQTEPLAPIEVPIAVVVNTGTTATITSPVVAPTPSPQPAPPKPTDVVYIFQADVWFDFDKFVLKSDGVQALTVFAGKYKEQGTSNPITVIGHTDIIGSLAYNQFLSIKRAEAVRDFLITQGIPKGIITPFGRAYLDPVAPNLIDGKDNPEGRAKNRRVEIRIGGNFVDYRNKPAVTSTITGSDSIIYPRRGGQASFEKLNAAFQQAIKSMAVEYKNSTGRPLVINSAYRTKQEQQDLYDAWSAAGGNRRTNPSVYTREYGTLFIPTNPSANEVSSHTLGNAIDTNQAFDLESRGLLTKYNMYRPDPIRDPIHIAFKGGGKQGRTE